MRMNQLSFADQYGISTIFFGMGGYLNGWLISQIASLPLGEFTTYVSLLLPLASIGFEGRAIYLWRIPPITLSLKTLTFFGSIHYLGANLAFKIYSPSSPIVPLAVR